MHYEFPTIQHVSECLKAIEGCDSFIVAERDRHTIINYVNVGTETFPPVLNDDRSAAIRRECRGIVFGPDGRVIARRLHKFFNVGERDEVAPDKVDMTKPHLVIEKLDGSMITPIPIGDHIRWGTKMGLTDVGFQVEDFVSRNPQYLELAKWCVSLSKTPIFEWCSRRQRIVVDYPQDSLTLIAIRNNVDGRYASMASMRILSEFYGIPLVQFMDWKHSRIEDAIERMRREPVANAEGYVVRFATGHMVKLKYEDYVRIHRAKDSILQEKRVLEMIMSEKVDDVLPHLIDHDREALTQFQDEVNSGILKTTREIHRSLEYWYEKVGGERKRFAIEAPIDKNYKSVCFSAWESRSMEKVLDELTTKIKKNLSSQARVDGIRWAWGSEAFWSDFIGVVE